MIQTFCNNNKMAHSHSRAPGRVQKQPVDQSWGQTPEGDTLGTAWTLAWTVWTLGGRLRPLDHPWAQRGRLRPRDQPARDSAPPASRVAA